MIISLKSSLKLIGIMIVCFCAVFVCTFFLNFYLDILPLRDNVSAELMPLYDAQLATARMCCAVTGGVLSIIAGIMLMFYVKLYIDEHAKLLGTLKAIGYSTIRLASSFIVFGLSAFVGCALGYGLGHAIMPSVYEWLTIEGLTVDIHYHISLLFALVFAPTMLFTVLAYVYAVISLRRPALEIIRNTQKVKQIKTKTKEIDKDIPFLREMCWNTVKNHKMLTFFVAFSCFCFSAMIQMGMSMESLVDGTMGWLILIIGIVLAVTSMLMAMTSLIKNNSKSLAMMKAMGYTLRERAIAVFAGYLPFIAIGFAIGTAYQYGLLQLMVNIIFKNVGDVPEYKFDVKAFFITLASFIVCYTLFTAIYLVKINKITTKEIMLED